MKVKLPGLPGVYYDTESDSAAITTVFTLAGRRAPKPQGYALQALPMLWALDVDLQEVPEDHPLQYLHPEGARSLDSLPRDPQFAGVGRNLDYALRFLAAINEETESAITEFVHGEADGPDGVTIDVEDGEATLALDGEREADPEREYGIETGQEHEGRESGAFDDDGDGPADR